MQNNLTFRFNAQQAKLVFQTLILFELCMVILYVMDHIFLSFGKSHLIIDLDGELTFPSWFSGIQLFCIGFLLIIQHYKEPRLKNISLWFISLIGIGFMFLSLDEIILFHEKLSLRAVPLDWLPRFKNNNGVWIPIYVALIVTFLIFSRQKIKDLLQYYRNEAAIFSTGLFLFLLGGVVLEIFAYQYLNLNELKKWYMLEVAFEEGLEMMGASVMLYASLLLTLH